MNYLDKARELGEALLLTPEVQAVKAAQAAILADEESRAAFLQYQEKEGHLLSAQMISKVISEKESLALIELKSRLINKYPLIKAFFQQQQKYEKLMAMVNLTLTSTIQGLPDVSQLPLPEDLKKMARQLLETIGAAKKEPDQDH